MPNEEVQKIVKAEVEKQMSGLQEAFKLERAARINAEIALQEAEKAKRDAVTGSGRTKATGEGPTKAEMREFYPTKIAVTPLSEIVETVVGKEVYNSEMAWRDVARKKVRGKT